MIIHNVEQNTPEWFEARRGIVTASAVGDVMSKGRSKNAPSIVRTKYMMKLAAERIGCESADTFTGNRHTERGHNLEPKAREMYAFLNDIEPELVGFITNDERTAGASPDALIGDNGTMQIKTKLPELHIPLLLNQELPKEHEPQVQTEIAIAEREFCDFVCYWPALPLVQIRVYRDEKRIKEIFEAIDKFNDELAGVVEKIKAMQ